MSMATFVRLPSSLNTAAFIGSHPRPNAHSPERWTERSAKNTATRLPPLRVNTFLPLPLPTTDGFVSRVHRNGPRKNV